MGSNLAASSRAILSKRSMGMDMGENMNPANLYAVLTIMAAAMLLPLSAMVEGPSIKGLWDATVNTSAEGWVSCFMDWVGLGWVELHCIVLNWVGSQVGLSRRLGWVAG